MVIPIKLSLGHKFAPTRSYRQYPQSSLAGRGWRLSGCGLQNQAFLWFYCILMTTPTGHSSKDAEMLAGQLLAWRNTTIQGISAGCYCVAAVCSWLL